MHFRCYFDSPGAGVAVFRAPYLNSIDAIPPHCCFRSRCPLKLDCAEPIRATLRHSLPVPASLRADLTPSVCAVPTPPVGLSASQRVFLHPDPIPRRCPRRCCSHSPHPLNCPNCCGCSAVSERTNSCCAFAQLCREDSLLVIGIAGNGCCWQRKRMDGVRLD